jgi:hypothetical protein
LLNWFSRSLAFFQGQIFSIEDSEALLSDLEEMEMIINHGAYYALTGLGKVCGWLYFSPYDVSNWYKNFNQIFKLDNCDDLCIAWALTDIRSNDWGYIPKDCADAASDMSWQLRNRGIRASNAVFFSVSAAKLLNGEEIEEGSLRNAARTIQYDIRRVVEALTLVDEMHAKWGKGMFWKTLPSRVQYGIPEEMTDLVLLPGVGGVRARKLWDNGVKTLRDITTHKDEISSWFNPALATTWDKEARKLIAQRKQGR